MPSHRIVTNIAQLRQVKGRVLGDLCTIEGDYTRGDGGAREYFWDTSAITGDDTISIVVPTLNPRGRWKCRSLGRITVTPLGNGEDDAPRLQAALDAAAYIGTVVMGTGAWTFATRWSVPNGTNLEMSPGVAPDITLGRTGAIPYTAAFFSEGGDAADITTLAADAAIGATTITVVSAAGIAVGDRLKIRLVGGVYLHLREVIAINGTTITIDRPLPRPYASGSGVAVITTTRDIHINGNGALITGEADAIVQFTACWNVLIENLRVSADTQGAFVLDVGSRDSILRNIHVDGLGTTTHAYIIDTNENTAMEDCSSTRCLNENIHFASNDNCHVRGGMHSRAGDNVLRLTVRHASDPYGCRGCTFAGVEFIVSTNAAVLVQNGSSGNTFEGCEASFGTVGLSLGSGAVGNVWKGGRFRGNSQLAISASGSTCLGNKVIGSLCHEHAAGVVQVTTGADLDLDDITVIDTSAAAVTAHMLNVTGAGGSVCRVHGGRWSTTRSALHGIILGDASARVYVDGAWKFTGGAANNAAVLVNGGVARLESLVAIAAFGVWTNNAAAYARVGAGVDVSGCTTPLQVSAGAMNRGQVTLTEDTPVAVAFGDAKAQDRLFWTRRTAGGTPGHVTVGAPTPGTGFSVVGQAGDTSVLDYEIR